GTTLTAGERVRVGEAVAVMLRLSVTGACTEYVPVAANAWSTIAPVPVLPSPKFHTYDTTVPYESRTAAEKVIEPPGRALCRDDRILTSGGRSNGINGYRSRITTPTRYGVSPIPSPAEQSSCAGPRQWSM